MASKQITGMQGVYLVAAELSRRGFIASTTSRGAKGADILVTDPSCRRAFSVQVKTNSCGSGYWLLNADAGEVKSDSHVYVFVSIGKDPAVVAEFFVVPSRVVAELVDREEFGKTTKQTWSSFTTARAQPYRDKWDTFEIQ